MIANLEWTQVLQTKTKTKQQNPANHGSSINQQQQNPLIRTDSGLSHWGSLNAFYWRQMFTLDSVVVKTQKNA